MAIFLLHQAAQVALTPIGEGMDGFGHWAYLEFIRNEGRAPTPEEPSVPDWLRRLPALVPGPDTSEGVRYAEWAGLPPDARSARRAAVDALPAVAGGAYEGPNYEAQQPPLYYAIAGALDGLSRSAGVEARHRRLCLISLLLVVLAFPAVYGILTTTMERRAAALALLSFAWAPNLMPFIGRPTNDALALPLLAWAVWAALRRPMSARAASLCGCLLVAGFFTKTYCLPVAAACGLMVAIDAGGTAGRMPQIRWRPALAFGIVTGAGALALFIGNAVTTGHILLLTEMRDTAALPLAERVAAMLRVPPVWFLGGLAKGLAWCGYWSAVSPGAWWYGLWGAPGVLFLLQLRRARRRGGVLALRMLWGHYALLAFFGLGMLWHASQFALRAQLAGETVYSGNEGWYLSVLIPSMLAIYGAWVGIRFDAIAGRRWWAGVCVLTMGLNLTARVAVWAFWTGAAPVAGRLRAIDWTAALAALGSERTRAAWLSCPGVTDASPAASLAPLAIALVMSACVVLVVQRAHRMTTPG